MFSIPISFRQIKFLLAVADTGSTAAAGRLLNISQPSISLAITACEEMFGQKLFVRIAGQGMELTTFGRHKIAQLRQLGKHAESVLVDKDDVSEFLDFGVFSTLGPRYGPQLVRLFQDKFPNVEIRLREGNLKTIFGWLTEGRIDLALIYDFGIPTNCSISPLRNIKPYALLPEGHRLAKRKEVEIRELLADPIILISLPHSRGYFLSLIQQEEIPAHIAFETPSIEMLRSMVANGFGTGLLATDIPGEVAYDGNVVHKVLLKGKLPQHQIALARCNTLPERTVVQEFIGFAQAHFDKCH